MSSAPTPPSRSTPSGRTESWRPGIAWQLGIGFLGVALLAGVANFAVQRTISITTTRLVPTPAHGEGWKSPTAPVASAPQPARQPPDGRDVLPLVDRLADTVDAAPGVAVPERQRRARAAASAVKSRLMELHGTAAGAAADAALRAANRLIELSATRRGYYDAYVVALGSIDAQFESALARAWKIMGRVVASQSLVAMDRLLDEVRRQAELLREENYMALEAERLQVLEQRLAEALAKGARGLPRGGEGSEQASIEEQFQQARALSGQLLAADAERSSALLPFHEQLGALRRGLLRAATVQPLYPSWGTAPAPEQHLLPGAQLAPATQLQLAPALVTREEDAQGIGRAGLAWLSAGVLALLLAVCVLTVLSIMRPVNRLIRATRRITLGDPGVRVPVGGAREIDRLASAFNVMAERLETAQGVARDYQQQLEARVVERTRQLQHQADHDALTLLPNRRPLFERLRSALAHAEEVQSAAGLFFLDLDNFKNINDGLGHGFGDRVLLAVAQRLTATLGERGWVARFGGDEFTVVAECPGGTQALRDLGWSLLRAFHEPLRFDGRELLVSVSVGAAFYPEHARDAEAMLSAADAALFRAKANGRSQLAEFTPELLEAAASRFAIEQGLRQALDRGELELMFQPELDMVSMEVDVAEALLRWRHPDGRLLRPGDFLAVAEQSGLITEINDWVLRSAIAAAARWRNAGFGRLRVAVNVSSRQLTDPDFPQRVLTLLEQQGVPASALEIELTETVLQTGLSTIDGLRRLQQLGVAIALDDFGTGYSTLASLECLPLNRVKLDRSLIDGIDSSPRCAAIAAAIIRLCRDLDVRITAEGVERASQLALLRGEGLLVQGYLLARPMSEPQLLQSLPLLPGLLESLLLGAPVVMPAGRANVVALSSTSETQRRRRPHIDPAALKA